ncbi:hypothetical protein [Undibacterium sp.]
MATIHKLSLPNSLDQTRPVVMEGSMHGDKNWREPTHWILSPLAAAEIS